ncbi:uncharacterized protein HD556DRAFT_1248919 [Suillus plorans]|uniref:Uncharacterized protein n=1 Tax=Suillus plorans TaxID=116603 RepID=A0A9P7ABJ3_9AGAM|nr:uncharacterized protein HD556DRAFT_1248919 [Suillus plorans]KAG1785995.1 hypothetical protein HD556DRAFT_1248919 [Suillus plorans]
MGFWYPSLNLGFWSNLPSCSPVENIFFHEALCIVSTIHDTVTHLPQHRRLAIFTDSLNSVYLFNSLSGGPGYNHLLMNVAEMILTFQVGFQVFHVSGDHNEVMDHLSQWRADNACKVVLGLQVLPFQPP